MATNTIQGKNVVLSFFKDSFLGYKCFESISIAVETEDEASATVGDGHWAKLRYKGLSWSVNLSGPLMTDIDNYTGFDIFEHQLGFVNVLMLCSFYDSEGNIKSVQGEALVSSTSFEINATSLVKVPTVLKGSGELKYFDGTIPCPTSVDSISVTGEDSADGIVTITYTYTGPVYQVKWRANGSGPYFYSLVGEDIVIPGLPVGGNTVEIIPVCTNGYEGTGDETTFTITHALSCALSVDTIVPDITGSTVILTITFSGDISTATYKYQIDDGTGFGSFTTKTGPFTGDADNLVLSLPIGDYNINIIPICANGVEGTNGTQVFSVTSSSTISTINYIFAAIPGGSPNFRVYKNGLLMVNLSASASGSFTANTGDVILGQVSVTQSGRDMTLTETNDTTSATIYNHSQITGGGTTTDSHSFTANGDTFTVHGVISP